MARNSAEKRSHPLDIALGSRVRLRRKELGQSQDTLARAVGITFQQVQKYEHGTNRISFSRLVEMSGALKCNVSDLIGDLDKMKSSGPASRQAAYLTAPGAGDLLQAYAGINSAKGRNAILNLARQLAREANENERAERGKGSQRR